MPAPLYLCVHVRDFAAQALKQAHELDSCAIGILNGDPPLERIFAMNGAARQHGLGAGMSRVQAESFPILLLRRDRSQENAAFAELIHCAKQFSPRIEAIASPLEDRCGATLVLDISGSERLLGSAQEIAARVRHAVRAIGYESSVVASHNASTALLVARGLFGAVAIAPGREAATLAPLPLAVLDLDVAQAETFDAWGIHSLGELAALPTKALAARLGQSGLRMQAQARGEHRHLLVPGEEAPDAPISESLELEHPVELLEPLLFLLSQMLEQILHRASERALAIASVETCLTLERNTLDLTTLVPDGAHYEHCRVVRPALPERDRLTLLKLIQLDLELHPPEAAIIALRLTAHPARLPVAQQGLFAAQAPEAGHLEILLARLRKLVGEGRVGAPELLDTHAPEPFRLVNFEIAQSASVRKTSAPPQHAPAMRMVRPPRAIAVELRDDTPAAMHYEGHRLILQAGSGPWRISGSWWTHPGWCREEWDVVLKEEPQRCLRLAHDPSASCWYVIGIYD
jgi:protein ImuB